MVGRPKVESGNEADEFGDSGRDNKDIGRRCEDKGDLDVELLPVAVHESTENFGVDLVKRDDPLGSKETVENEANDSGQTVLCEQIEGVIDVDQVLDCPALLVSPR